MSDQPCANTDRELWREREGDYYADSLHVTESGAIGIDCGGLVIVRPVRAWHELAKKEILSEDPNAFLPHPLSATPVAATLSEQKPEDKCDHKCVICHPPLENEAPVASKAGDAPPQNALLPCPFCGEEKPPTELGNMYEENFKMCCQSCKAVTGRYRTRNEAIEAWNQRVAPSVVAGVGEHAMGVSSDEALKASEAILERLSKLQVVESYGTEQYRFGGLDQHAIHNALTAIRKAKSLSEPKESEEEKKENKEYSEQPTQGGDQTQTALTVCPFCGSTEAREVDLGQDDDFFAIQCWRNNRVGCGAAVGSRVSFMDARGRWNERAATSVGPGTENQPAHPVSQTPSPVAHVRQMEREPWTVESGPGCFWRLKQGQVLIFTSEDRGLLKVFADAHNETLAPSMAGWVWAEKLSDCIALLMAGCMDQKSWEEAKALLDGYAADKSILSPQDGNSPATSVESSPTNAGMYCEVCGNKGTKHDGGQLGHPFSPVSSVERDAQKDLGIPGDV